uniref:Uncharacterized protein n=1 Tax=Paramormyrops kingsleyae TaxID=1676925 RepID=A0A3B3RTE1_9TELE
MSGSISSRGPGDTGAALFNNPTSSSNSEANTEDAGASSLTSPGQEGSLRCCR